MSELNLEVSERFTERDANSIRTALSQHLQVSKPVFLFRRSIDPLSTILLLGAVAAWQILVKPAADFRTAYAKQLGKRAADRTADKWRWFKNKDVKPLADTATALVDAAGRVGGEVRIGAGLNIPDDHFGTVIWMESRDPVEVARMLSAFIVRAEKIAHIMQTEIDRGREPFGPAIIELQEDGSVTIRWKSASDFKACEEHVP